MIDLEDILSRAVTVALSIAEDEAHKPAVRLQAVGAATRAASALQAVSGAQHVQEERDLLWIARTIERPVGALPRPKGAMIDRLRLQRVDRIIEAHAQEKHVPEVPDW